MNEGNRRMELLGSAPIPKALLAMGLPAMIGMMINALYNLVDAYFVGGLGTSQMGAISVAFPLGQIVAGLGLLFGNGAASYISRLLGYGEKETANKAASTALYGSLLAGAVMIVCALLFLEPVLILLGATESILPYAFTMNSIVTSEGAARTTMCALMAGAVLNIVLDPVFIYVLGLGVTGAATATAISQAVSALVYLRYVLRRESVFTFRVQDCCFTGKIISEIMKVGIPTLVFQLLTGLSITLINLQAKEYGDSVIAGLGAVTRITAMGSLMVFGFIKGFQPIAGFNYGAEKYDRLCEAVRTAIIWSTVFCAVYGLTLALFSTAIISGFTKGDGEMIRAGRKALAANGCTFLLFGFYTVYSSLFLALGKAREGFILGACRQGICFVPVIWLLPSFIGMDGILFAQPVSDVISAAAAVIMAVRLHRELAHIKIPCSCRSAAR